MILLLLGDNDETEGGGLMCTVRRHIWCIATNDWCVGCIHIIWCLCLQYKTHIDHQSCCRRHQFLLLIWKHNHCIASLCWNPLYISTPLFFKDELQQVSRSQCGIWVICVSRSGCFSICGTRQNRTYTAFSSGVALYVLFHLTFFFSLHHLITQPDNISSC